MIELGGNDGLRGFTPALVRQNLTQMIELAKAQQTHVVLTQIQLPRNYGARYLRQFEQIFPELATQYSLPLLPFFIEDIALKPEMILSRCWSKNRSKFSAAIYKTQ